MSLFVLSAAQRRSPAPPPLCAGGAAAGVYPCAPKLNSHPPRGPCCPTCGGGGGGITLIGCSCSAAGVSGEEEDGERTNKPSTDAGPPLPPSEPLRSTFPFAPPLKVIVHGRPGAPPRGGKRPGAPPRGGRRLGAPPRGGKRLGAPPRGGKQWKKRQSFQSTVCRETRSGVSSCIPRGVLVPNIGSPDHPLHDFRNLVFRTARLQGRRADLLQSSRPAQRGPCGHGGGPGPGEKHGSRALRRKARGFAPRRGPERARVAWGGDRRRTEGFSVADEAPERKRGLRVASDKVCFFLKVSSSGTPTLTERHT